MVSLLGADVEELTGIFSQGRALVGTDTSLDLTAMDGDFDVPDAVEAILEQLFQSLQDKVPYHDLLTSYPLTEPETIRTPSFVILPPRALRGSRKGSRQILLIKSWKRSWRYSRFIQ